MTSINDFLPDEIASLRKDIRTPEARAALGRMPSWGSPWGPGGTVSLAVPPIRSAPRVRGMFPDARPINPKEGLRDILASPLGIVAVLGGPLITVLDPDTGKVHATTPVTGSNTPPLTLEAEALFIHGDDQLCAIDFWTDQDLYRSPVRVPDGELHLWSVTGRRSGLSKPQARVTLPKGFRTEFGGRVAQDHGVFAAFGPYPRVSTGMVVGNSLGLRIGPGLVAVNSHAENVAFSQHLVVRPDTGAVVWQAEGTVSALDDLGALCTHLMDATVLRDREGAVRWSVTGGRPGGMSSSRVVQHVPEGLSLLDRRDGRRVATVPKPDVHVLHGDQLVCVYGRKLEAFTPDGQSLWTYQNDEVIHSIAPYPGRIYGLTRQKTVVCLEDDI